jgi:hypothetical protein
MQESLGQTRCLFFKLRFSVEFVMMSLFCYPVFSQQTPFQEFVVAVDEIYDNLTLNDASLTISKVNLINFSSGVAFAHFDRRNNKRLILINYSYLYNNVWIQKDFQSTRDDIIRGILAHEWAHHYLGHTFERASVLNERNADIMAGRVLAESRAMNVTAMTQILQNLSKSPHHLDWFARRDLMDKGKHTHELIHTTIEKLWEKIENDAATVEKKKKLKDYQALLDNRKKIIDDSLIFERGTLVKRLSSDLLNLFDKIKTKDTIHKNISDWLEIDTITTPPIIRFSNRLPSNSHVDSVKSFVKKDLENDNALIQAKHNALITQTNVSKAALDLIYGTEIKKLSSLLYYNENDTTNTKESFYNKWYFIERPLKEHNEYVEVFTKFESSKMKFNYKLKGGVLIDIDIDLLKAWISIAGQKQEYLLKVHLGKDKKIDPDFPYYFETIENETFYLDKSRQLWNKTIAARSLNDKIFLQKHE